MISRHDVVGGGGWPTTTRAVVGLGTFPFTGQLSPVPADQAAVILDEFVAAGGQYVETAPSYHNPAIDLGRLLRRHRRDELVLATKCLAGDVSVAQQLRGELRRLGVDYLDVVQVRVRQSDPVDAVTDALAALVRAQQAGCVRRIGLSRVTASVLAELAGGPRIDMVQNRLSVIHRAEHSDALADSCHRHGALFNPCQVLERGQLCDVSVPPDVRAAADIRRRKSEYREPVHGVIRRWVTGTLVPLAHDHGLSTEQLSIGWAASRPHVRTVVVGASSPEQVRHSMGAPRTLRPELLVMIDSAYRALAAYVRTEFGVPLDRFRGG